MRVYLGADHAGFELKEKLKAFLTKEGFEVVDKGAYTYDKDDDYPDFCADAARGVAESPENRGFVFGKSGSGEMIVANKIKGIRCTLALNEENVRLSREHNSANMLSFGSEFVGQEKMQELALLFLRTDFTNEERHIRRIQKISQLE
jgi:ribose 5-phosphate isomerase B